MVRCLAVSVVVPTYNGAAFLGEALQSVFTQSLPPAEVLIVDDASTDGTADLAEELARSAPVPVHVIRLAQNSGGPARPLNVGVNAAQGPLIAVLDQDDVFAPDKLDVQAGILTRQPDLTAVLSYCASLQERTRPIQETSVLAAVRETGEQKTEFWHLKSDRLLHVLMQYGNFLMGYPGFLFRRADWLRKGGADEGLRISSDYDLLCWLALQGPAALVPRVLYFRRDHEANLCKREREVYLETMQVKARYTARERWLLEDEKLSQSLREELYGLAYWMRESGRIIESLRYYRLVSRLWGWDRRTFSGMLKLLPLGLLGLLRGKTVESRA